MGDNKKDPVRKKIDNIEPWWSGAIRLKGSHPWDLKICGCDIQINPNKLTWIS
jgi:hypothetical protein